jgi:wyosine [tRNA(Phe)-imidazoG37] synthetase (radical SAM superfamily)
MYKYLFGPVPSRRLGMSLGIDLVFHKLCSLNCVYCECGETTVLTSERKEYVPFDKVTEELSHFMSNNPFPDYLTFSGSGEPTLNSRIGDVIRFVKKNYPEIPLALLTNGTLLHQKDLRQDLLEVDLMIPSLDSASENGFKKINRPDSKLILEEYIQGLVDFRNEYPGKMWLEVLIVPGFNDSTEELNLLKKSFLKIKPDLIQINTLDRPAAIEGIRAATQAELKHILDYWNIENTEIIAAAKQRKDIRSYREDTEAAILETIQRRPCTADDLAKILGSHISEVNKYLDVLEAEGRITSVREKRGVFYHGIRGS